MQLLCFYLLKVIACSGLLMLYYRLALRNKRFHYYNRFYLLFAVAASLLLPLLQLNLFTVKSNNTGAIVLLNILHVKRLNANAYNNPGFLVSYVYRQVLYFAAYAFVGLLLLAILLTRVVKIYAIKKKYGHTNMAAFDFISTDLRQAPFSFLQNLFWRSDININEPTGRQILQHELTHIRQKHTWDKLWMKVVTSVLWINPFFWFIQKELYMLHEFIADEKAIENNDGAAFAAMLITSQFGRNIFSPAQPFSYSPIKRRLFMLTNLTKPRYSYARRLMLLPLLAAVVMLFAFRVQKTIISKEHQSHQEVSTAPIEDTTKPQPLYVLNGKIVGKADVDALNASDIESINVLKDKAATDKHGNKGMNGVVEFTTKNNNAGAHQPLYVLDGKIADENPLKNLNPNNIEGVVVLKDNTATAKYGNKGAYGVVEITTKSFGNASDAMALYIFNGKIVKKAEVDKLPASEIESINVLNGKAATNKYGDKGVNGAVEFTTKKAVADGAAAEITPTSAAAPNTVKTLGSDSTVQVDKNNISRVKPAPLYVLNGKIVNEVDFKIIDPNTIKMINVLKAKMATDIYGDKGNNGVVEVYTNGYIQPNAYRQ